MPQCNLATTLSSLGGQPIEFCHTCSAWLIETGKQVSPLAPARHLIVSGTGQRMQSPHMGTMRDADCTIFQTLLHTKLLVDDEHANF